MDALLVVAHPKPDSFTHACAHAARSGLERAGHRVRVVDLYEQGSRVAMTCDERHAYHGATPLIDALASEHADLVLTSNVLVFVYPTWWSGLPAILKGWLERVLVPGVGFTFDEQTGEVRPGLGHVRRLVGVSTYGSSRGYVAAINDNGRRTITRALRMSCGWRTRTTWLAMYGIDASAPDDRTRFLRRVEGRLARLR